MDNGFWLNLDQLAAACTWRIDRPRGTPHPQILAVHNTGPQAAILIERPKEHNP